MKVTINVTIKVTIIIILIIYIIYYKSIYYIIYNTTNGYLFYNPLDIFLGLLFLLQFYQKVTVFGLTYIKSNTYSVYSGYFNGYLMVT